MWGVQVDGREHLVLLIRVDRVPEVEIVDDGDEGAFPLREIAQVVGAGEVEGADGVEVLLVNDGVPLLLHRDLMAAFEHFHHRWRKKAK